MSYQLQTAAHMVVNENRVRNHTRVGLSLRANALERGMHYGQSTVKRKYNGPQNTIPLGPVDRDTNRPDQAFHISDVLLLCCRLCAATSGLTAASAGVVYHRLTAVSAGVLYNRFDCGRAVLVCLRSCSLSVIFCGRVLYCGRVVCLR